MVTVQNLLKVKGNSVWSISPDTTVLVALKSMTEKDIGAFLVLENDAIAGIISERDFVHSIAETGQCVLQAPVSEYMTREVIVVNPAQTIEDCMLIMTEKRIRHLPVVEHDKVVGVISIGDVVREIISSRESTIVQLENFIEGSGYAQ